MPAVTRDSLKLAMSAVALTALAVTAQADARTLHPWGTSPCPPPGDTLSLLQPRDSAFADADTFATFLRSHGMVLNCITRTTIEGELGVRRAAGFQTDRGPIMVLFFAGAGRVRVEERRTSRGYHYRFRNAPHPGVRDSIDTDGPMHFVTHGSWFILAPDAAVAATLRVWLP